MAEFSMKIAGQGFAVRSLFDSTKDYCRGYLIHQPGDILLEVRREELDAMQAELRQEAIREGMKVRTFSDPFLERSVLQKKAAQQLLAHDTLLFHGSGLAVDGQGYLFTAAKCGTGKSTHTRYWREVLGSRVTMVNDDKPFLKVTESGVQMYGAPWSGKHGLDTNICVPLKGLCILRRGAENRIRSIQPEEALAMLLHQSQAPQSGDDLAQFHRLVEALARTIPLWQLECTRDPQAAVISYTAMSK